jgi:hypothetical protein
LAKAGLYAVVTFVVTAAASLVAFLVAQPFFGSRGVGLGVAELPGALLGTAGYLTAIAVLAVALGFLLRSTAGGIATLFGLLLVVPPIAHFLPASWQDHVLPYLPNYAGTAVTTVNVSPSCCHPRAGRSSWRPGRWSRWQVPRSRCADATPEPVVLRLRPWGGDLR